MLDYLRLVLWLNMGCSRLIDEILGRRYAEYFIADVFSPAWLWSDAKAKESDQNSPWRRRAIDKWCTEVKARFLERLTFSLVGNDESKQWVDGETGDDD